MNKKATQARPAAKSAKPVDKSRTVREQNPDERGERGRTSDAAERSEVGLLSEDELQQLFRDEFQQSALPTPPEIPGFHLCWLSTTSGYDTLQKRMRLGYKPVSRSELPGFDPTNGGELANYEGYVTCNEMILAKIPERVYQSIMKYFHHTMPLEEETAIVKKTKEITQHESQAQSMERDEFKKDMGDGTTELERSVKHGASLQPSFT